MDQQTLLTIMAVFVTISAIALIIQAGFLFAIYKASRSMADLATKMSPKVESLVETSRATIEESRSKIVDITSRASQILEKTQDQLARVDALMADATERGHRQLARAELLVDDTLSKAHSTVNTVHTGVMKPLREISGVAAGIKAAVQYLRANKTGPDRFTVDEEMFI